MAQHLEVVAQHIARLQRLTALRAQGLRQPGEQQQPERHPQQRQDGEDHRPVPEQQPATQHGRQQRCQVHGQHHHRHHAHHLFTDKEIPQQGADHHSGRRSPQCLQQTAGQQPGQRGSKGTTDGGQDKESDTKQQHGFAPHTVGDGAIEELADGKSGQKGTDRQLHCRDITAQIAGYGRDRGQIHVHRQRRQGRKRAQDQR